MVILLELCVANPPKSQAIVWGPDRVKDRGLKDPADLRSQNVRKRYASQGCCRFLGGGLRNSVPGFGRWGFESRGVRLEARSCWIGSGWHPVFAVGGWDFLGFLVLPIIEDPPVGAHPRVYKFHARSDVEYSSSW
eukprot:gene22367-biopygen5740